MELKGWALAHCPPSSKWGPGGDTGEMKAAMKGTGYPTSQSRWPRTSVLSNGQYPMYESYMGLTFTFYLYFCLTIKENVYFYHGHVKFKILEGYYLTLTLLLQIKCSLFCSFPRPPLPHPPKHSKLGTSLLLIYLRPGALPGITIDKCVDWNMEHKALAKRSRLFTIHCSINV